MKGFVLSVLLASTASALPQPVSGPQHVRRQNQIIPVVVGGAQVTFVPNSIVAAVGDIVQFQFANGNHTVTQSTSTQACVPMQGGVHSGHIPFVDGQAEVGTFNMPIVSKDPMFLYCATGPHCQLGQVMIINPTSARQVADYAKLSSQTTSSTDGTTVVGGAVGKMGLDIAAFIPAPPKAAAPPPPPAAAPPAAAPAAASSAAAPPPAASSAAPTPSAAEAAAPSAEAVAPPAEAPPAEAPAEAPAAR